MKTLAVIRVVWMTIMIVATVAMILAFGVPN